MPKTKFLENDFLGKKVIIDNDIKEFKLTALQKLVLQNLYLKAKKVDKSLG